MEALCATHVIARLRPRQKDFCRILIDRGCCERIYDMSTSIFPADELRRATGERLSSHTVGATSHGKLAESSARRAGLLSHLITYRRCYVGRIFYSPFNAQT